MLERYDPRNLAISWDGLADALIVLGGSTVAAILLHWIVFAILQRVARLSPNAVDDLVVKAVRTPTRWAMIGFALSIAAHTDALEGRVWDIVTSYISPALLGWVAYAVVKGLAAGWQAQLQLAGDPVAYRSQLTRIAILARTAKVAIAIITVSLVMLNIPGVRDIGVTMMASAGLAALAVGAAAQPALKSLIAGIQMALTQPLRIGDLVKVDGQAGRVEEIRMSFVTVRTWDERVLVVPTSRFLDQSFENWSRVNERLTGAVFLRLDPASEIEPIRAEFERFIKTCKEWDGRTATALMTEAYPESIEVRLAVSSATIGELFTLRCLVREHMLGWLRIHMPDSLIRHRLEVGAADRRAVASED